MRDVNLLGSIPDLFQVCKNMTITKTEVREDSIPDLFQGEQNNRRYWQEKLIS